MEDTDLAGEVGLAGDVGLETDAGPAVARDGVGGVDFGTAFGTARLVTVVRLATEGALLAAEAVRALTEGAIDGALLAVSGFAADVLLAAEVIGAGLGRGGGFVAVGVLPAADTLLLIEAVVDPLAVRNLASGAGASSRLTRSRTDVIPALTTLFVGTGDLTAGGSGFGPTGFLAEAVVDAEAVRTLLGPAAVLLAAGTGGLGVGFDTVVAAPVVDFVVVTDFAVRVVLTLVVDGAGDDLPLLCGGSGMGRVGFVG